MAYPFQNIEQFWQDQWLKEEAFEPSTSYEKPKKYILSMFPYPSGRIHMGHVRNYSLGDAFARYYRKKGFNVLHPIGWDSFGMPAENAAIKHQVHPKKWTYENIDYMRKELHQLGLSFSQKREFATSDEQYTKFEQAFLIDMYNSGLLYSKKGLLNWCPHDQTVLANEQVEDGKCWRCGTNVVMKEMNGYYIAITRYAKELLDDLSKLEQGWPKQVLTMQENWIGQSSGLTFSFSLSETSQKAIHHLYHEIEVFTTRPDTIYGVTYAAVAPEHPLIMQLLSLNYFDSSTRECLEQLQKIPSRERGGMEKVGIDTKLTLIHPLTHAEIPLWIANFVLTDYGSGAVMAVPAHDTRDWEFATKYNLPKKVVIRPLSLENIDDNAYTEEGILYDSEIFSGLSNSDAKEKIIAYFEETNLGKKTVNYRLRDWGVSRQRYWGAPIPLVHCQHCGVVAEKKENLPIALPHDVAITGEGNPLEHHPTWKYCQCPTCGRDALRETDTMDTFIQSSWYFLRFCVENSISETPFTQEDLEYWMSVDHYIGGIEHAILHLLYARFFTKALRDLGYISVDEPFKALLTQGMVLKDGFKMSKSKGNTVDPDELIEKYGADTARLFILFAAPPTKELEWNDNAVEGCFRFLNRLYDRSVNAKNVTILPEILHNELSENEKIARLKVYEALRKSEQAFSETFAFNTVIAACMEALNALNEQNHSDVWTEGYFILLSILEPFVPHIANELSQKLFQRKNFIVLTVKDEVFVKESITLAITINGKKRTEIQIGCDWEKEAILSHARLEAQKWIEGKVVIKEVLVPQKLVNFVIKEN